MACPKAKIVIFGDAIRKPFIANPAAIPWTTGGRHEGRLRRRAPPSRTSAAACSTGQRGRIRNPSRTGSADRSSPPCRIFTHPSGRGRFAQGDQLSVEMDDKAQTMNRDPWLRTVSPGFAGNSLPVCPTMPRGITGRCITRLQHSSGGRDARLGSRAPRPPKTSAPQPPRQNLAVEAVEGLSIGRRSPRSADSSVWTGRTKADLGRSALGEGAMAGNETPKNQQPRVLGGPRSHLAANQRSGRNRLCDARI